MSPKSISAVIPVYNEAEIIEESVVIFLSELSKITPDFEVILVDDGSTDATRDIVNRLSLADNRIKALFNDKNRGSGTSLWKGFMEAQKEFVISNFADRPFDLKELSGIMPLFNSSEIDFVIVARQNRSANTLYRKITSLANLFLIKLLFSIKIRDFQFVQAYRKKALEGINIISTGTFVPPELIIRLLGRGCKYEQIVSVFHPRTKGKSKCGNAAAILNTLYDMIRFWFYWRFFYNKA